MKHELVAVQNVKDLQDTGKRWLEGVLGHHLQDTQQVFIMVFTPGVPPTDAAREEARAGFRQTWDKVQDHMAQRGVSNQEFDAAVDEAMDRVRRWNP